MLYIPVKELSVTTTAKEVVQSDLWRVFPSRLSIFFRYRKYSKKSCISDL